MATAFRVKPNWLVLILSIIFLIYGICGIICGVAMLFVPQMLPYDLWLASGLITQASVIYQGIFFVVSGFLALLGGISGLRGKFAGGRWALGWLIAFSCYACIVNLCGGFGPYAGQQALVGIVLPALWFVGTWRSEEVIVAW